jgi:GntR family transcriptional regulator
MLVHAKLLYQNVTQRGDCVTNVLVASSPRVHSDATAVGVNRDSKLPLYHQLYEILRDTITRSEWKPGDMIPAESELMQVYGVSRTTVRQVLDKLVSEGLIYRRQGRGSFVAHPTLDQVLTRIVSFTDEMRQRGFEPGTQVLDARLIPASGEIAKHLAIEPGEELAYLQRLRLANGEPMAIEHSHLVHRYCPGVLQQDYMTNPLHEGLDRLYGIRWSRARQVIRAVKADATCAQLLAIKRGDALLFVERVSFSDRGVPVEFLQVYYRGDRYSLYAELRD